MNTYDNAQDANMDAMRPQPPGSPVAATAGRLNGGFAVLRQGEAAPEGFEPYAVYDERGVGRAA